MRGHVPRAPAMTDPPRETKTRIARLRAAGRGEVTTLTHWRWAQQVSLEGGSSVGSRRRQSIAISASFAARHIQQIAENIVIANHSVTSSNTCLPAAICELPVKLNIYVVFIG